MPRYRIMEARTAKGWSQAVLADKVGTSQQQIARWESNAVDVKAGVMIRLAKALDVEVTWLMGLDEQTGFPDSLAPEEAGILLRYRNMTRDGQTALVDVSKSLLRSFPAHPIEEDSSSSAVVEVA